eukprot:scaffold5477_cov124-Isochrysis_galbana.AAC.4
MLAPWAKGLMGTYGVGVSIMLDGKSNSGGYIGANGMGRLWVLPAVIGTIKRGDRTLTLYRGVAHLELCRGFCDGTGGEDLRIGKPWVEALQSIELGSRHRPRAYRNLLYL